MPFGRGQRYVRNLGETVERRIGALDEFVARGACRLAASDRVVHALADRFVAFEGLLVGGLDGLDNLLRYARSGGKPADRRPAHFGLGAKLNGALLSGGGEFAGDEALAQRIALESQAVACQPGELLDLNEFSRLGIDH